ncbi:hypothetical protein BJ912DRAFT_987198 [Pholiota molesta]|nr:hypothetical protein BJ912DRAFT_987198 [Pholiota molesta]
MPLAQSRDDDIAVENHRNYGSIGYGNTPARFVIDDGSSRYIDGNLSYDEDSELTEEEEEWILDEELEKQGLNYKNLLLLYTLVPLSALLAFVSLALLPVFAFPTRHTSPFPYPPYLPFPLPEVLTATALWSLSYLLRDFLYASALSLTSTIPFPTHRYGAFRRVWWTALGWAAVEAVVGIKQGYENIGLYKDVLVSAGLITDTSNHRAASLMAENQRNSPRERTPSDRQPLNDVDITPTPRDYDTQPQSFSQHGNGDTRPQQQGRQISSSSLSSDSILRQYHVDGLQSSGIFGESQPLLPVNATLPPLTRHMTNDSDRILAENEVERDLEALIALKNREELEEIYGIPFIRIPVFLSCLHRINSILSSLGATLLLTAAYMRSTFAYHPPSPNLYWLSPDPTTPAQPFRPSNTTLLITFPILLVVQAMLTFMHTPWIMPRLGIHTFVYIGLLVSLGLFFGGLGVWEALT